MSSTASPSQPAAGEFSFSQARSLVKDLFQPRPGIYWADFLLTILSGYVLFHLVLFMHQLLPERFVLASALQAVLFVAYVVLFMRAAMFIHELVHLPKEGFGGFRFAWNLLCGIPFLIPSFMYYPHIDHHRRKHYGTEHDGEYMSLSHRPVWYIVGFIVQSLVIPVLGYLRFLIISPICWFVPGARRWVHEHASTMVVDPFYRRTQPSVRIRRIIVLQEFLCFAFLFWMTIRPLVVWGDWWAPVGIPFFLQAYATGVAIVTLNALRTLGAHRWVGDGEAMSFVDQLLDSVNYPERPWVTELWGPVGTRYHALHHLFPSMPYHNLGEAHRRLMEGLPADSPYRDTVRVSLTRAMVELWQRARASRRAAQSEPAPAIPSASAS